MTKEELAKKWGKCSDKPIKLEWVDNTLTMANNPKEEFLSDLNEFLAEKDKEIAELKEHLQSTKGLLSDYKIHVESRNQHIITLTNKIVNEKNQSEEDKKLLLKMEEGRELRNRVIELLEEKIKLLESL